MITSENFPKLVDHTLLRPDATAADIRTLCLEANQIKPASVCVNPMWASLARSLLRDVRLCVVVGFPLGASTATSVANEAREAVANGAHEIDMVVPLGLVKTGVDMHLESYLRTVRQAAPHATMKLILETAVLTDAEIVRVCMLALKVGMNYVKTSTGFNAAGGATTHAVELMKQTVGSHMRIKASGGIRTLADVEAMVAAGATRIGMSATMAVVKELREREAAAAKPN